MRALPASLLAALVAVGCSDALIEKRQVQDINVDDKLAIAGRVCSSVPDPSGFPVKVVMIVDQSGSMCISDPPGSQGSPGFCEMYGTVPPGVTQPARVRAVNRLVDQFTAQPNVQVALIPFETNVKGVWPVPTGPNPQRFGRPDSTLRTRINTLQAELGKGTDYQGALAYAYSLIASDIVATEASTPEVLPRTRYVVVFLTDGVPFPKCSANDNLTQFADDLNPELTWADSYGAGDFCNRIDPMDPDAITGYVAGTDRNQNYQLFSYVKQITDLKDQYNVGDVRLHAVLMFNEEAVRNCGPICQDVYGQYVRWPGPVAVPDGPSAAKAIAAWTLQQLAQRGNGVYQEFSNFAGLAQLNLGALDYASLASRNVMKNIMVQALSSEPGAEKRQVDTDGDGLIDEFDNDFTHNTNKNFGDSDDDGFDDNFEVRRFEDGFRPAAKDGRGCDPASPLTPGCRSRDTDGDGLSQYAEAYLKTRPTLVDSDADGVPDGMEVRYGLDPGNRLVSGIDTDADGTSDTEEFRLGSNPVTRDVPFQQKGAYQFAIKSEVQADDSVCYDFKVSNLQLVTPPNRAGLTQGYNLFKVWFAEAPESGVATDYGVWKAACFWAQYDPPSVRIPSGPEGPPLSDSDFVAPQNIATPAQYDTTCLGVSPARGTP
ncbi:MAG: VWA domain-containing protein [Archangium sp.]|nr:VWA domain-containing protein [Archangium sp.]